MRDLDQLLAQRAGGQAIEDVEALRLAEFVDPAPLMRVAEAIARSSFGESISYSRKVFIPLTKLCRNVCHYCTFAQSPKVSQPAFLTLDEVLAIARAGLRAGCREALFTLGDKPELRYAAAKSALAEMGFSTTLSYLQAAAAVVLKETGLLPHLNPGVLDETDLRTLRTVSASQGLMLESISQRLCEKGGAHFGSPDKAPGVRLETLDAAGRARVPFTTGLLIGIGETREERIQALLAIRDAHHRHGHVQEVIIQNFKAKPATRMAKALEPSLDDHLWTIAAARLLLPSDISLQAPPNLQIEDLQALARAGINDWGGVSPVTPDHVNPEAPWPNLKILEAATRQAGRALVQRVTVYPKYLKSARDWIDPAVHRAVLRHIDAEGYAREDDWVPGTTRMPPELPALARQPSVRVRAVLDKSRAGQPLEEADIVALFTARGGDLGEVIKAADRLRFIRNGQTVSYAVVRNINYTNVCTYGCKFCAFSKGRHSAQLRGPAYNLDLSEVARRSEEAWQRGATEVCMQGGIHPDYTGKTYLSLVEAVKAAVPEIHVHAFSALEIAQGARTLGLSVERYLSELKAAGLGSMPGTAAEILDDAVRKELCPDKLSTAEWLEIVGTAHSVGLRTTATIMFGHVDGYEHWARHLIRLRELQRQTGGFTEFVPLPFIHMEAPISLKGQSRSGPTFREAILMHAVARIVLDPLFANIQCSWVKLGPEAAAVALEAGANDLGGTLMNESISRAAGTEHGQEFTPRDMEALIHGIVRTPRQRTTLYGDAAPERIAASRAAAALGSGRWGNGSARAASNG
jgi:FO synthase